MAAAIAIDSLVDILVEHVLSFHSAACAADDVMEQLVSDAICDDEAANDAMTQFREAARAVDSVLDDVVSYIAADAEDTQAEVVGSVLNELISSAVGGPQAALAQSLSDLNRQTKAWTQPCSWSSAVWLQQLELRQESHVESHVNSEACE